MYQMTLNILELCLGCGDPHMDTINEAVLRLTNETDDQKLEMTMRLKIIYIYEFDKFR